MIGASALSALVALAAGGLLTAAARRRVGPHRQAYALLAVATAVALLTLLTGLVVALTRSGHWPHEPPPHIGVASAGRARHGRQRSALLPRSAADARGGRLGGLGRPARPGRCDPGHGAVVRRLGALLRADPAARRRHSGGLSGDPARLGQRGVEHRPRRHHGLPGLGAPARPRRAGHRHHGGDLRRARPRGRALPGRPGRDLDQCGHPRRRAADRRAGRALDRPARSGRHRRDPARRRVRRRADGRAWPVRRSTTCSRAASSTCWASSPAAWRGSPWWPGSTSPCTRPAPTPGGSPIGRRTSASSRTPTRSPAWPTGAGCCGRCTGAPRVAGPASCSASTWTASSTSTTCAATTWVTRCWPRSAGGCVATCAPATWPPGSAGTSSRC